MLKNQVIYLVGPPGVGKLTVANELARIAGCRVVDNHSWLNPVFGVIQQDGVMPLPAGIWPLVARVRSAVLEAIAAYAPADWSFVFTHAATGDPAHESIDRAICDEIKAVAIRRRAGMLAVRLTCSADELARRVGAPERRQQMKECDTEAARSNALRETFDPGWDRTITIETSSLSARQTAEQILLEASELPTDGASDFP